MVDVTIDADRVLDRVNLDENDVAKAKVETFIDDAVAAIETELGVSIGELSGDAGSKTIDVDKKYAPVITNLSAIYCLVFISGGTASGLSYSIGDISISESASESSPPIAVLEREMLRGIERLRAEEIKERYRALYKHELTVSLEVPAYLEPGDPSLLSATVCNPGLSNETNVELFLLINGTEVESVVLPELLSGSSYTLSHLWTPTVEGIYNVTAYAPPVPDENVTANNIATKLVDVRPVSSIWVDPKNTACLSIGDTFDVDIFINITSPTSPSGTGLMAFEYKFQWDSTVINCTSHTTCDPAADLGWGLYFQAKDQLTEGDHWYAVSGLLDPSTSPFTGVASLCTYTFEVVGAGGSALDIYDDKLGDDALQPIDHTTVDGVYCPAAPECEVTFLTDPAGPDYSITFEGKTYHDGDMDTFPNGTSDVATTSCPVGWVFDSWETADNVSVTDSIVTIICGGVLKAVFVERELAPTIESCDLTGARKDIFDLDETVYVNGSGYAPRLSIFDIYVVNDTTWNDGKPIPERVPDTVTTVSSNSFGKIDPTAVWSDLTVGKYDIVVDVNGNGVYDEGIDALDDIDIQDTAGFLVIPEYALGAILGLIACFAAFGIFLRSKRIHRVKTP